MTESAPLSLPAILRNPGLTERYAHLQDHSHFKQHSAPIPNAIKKLRREHNEGKRWIRRKDNARFTDNPHIVAATRLDYSLPTPRTTPTFPEPLPPYLSRNNKIPVANPPVYDPNSANAGRFSLSLKGMRRELRRSGFRAEALVRDVELEIVKWFQAGGTVLAPDAKDSHIEDLDSPGAPIGNTSTIFEIHRTPLQLVWSTSDDSFARYVVHCCARYHEIVSFSKDISGRRLTYILRPNVTRSDHRAPIALYTPPVTDLDYSSFPDTESERGGLETDSDVEQPPPLPPRDVLSAISEDTAISPPPITHAALVTSEADDETWSVIGDTDIETDDSKSDAGLAMSLKTLSLQSTASNQNNLSSCGRTPRADFHLQPRSLLPRVTRSASSPSRSPARRSFRRGLRHDKSGSRRLGNSHQHQSFYNYLFL